MSVCAYIRPDGTRCSAGVGTGSEWCYNHDPNREEERKRNARKGGRRAGRGRPLSELAALRSENGQLRERMLKGELDPRLVAVAVQSINVDIRCLEATLKAKEQEVLEGRLEELEAAETRRSAGSPRAAAWGGMVGLRDRLKRLVREREKDSILLADGSRYFFDPIESGVELFLHTQACLAAHESPEDWPEPPEIVKAMVRAIDRRAAYERLFDDEIPVFDIEETSPVAQKGASFTPFPYRLEAFIERGELVPRSLIKGCEPAKPIP